MCDVLCKPLELQEGTTEEERDRECDSERELAALLVGLAVAGELTVRLKDLRALIDAEGRETLFVSVGLTEGLKEGVAVSDRV